MEEQLPSVKRGDWVFVEDAVAFDGCVVAVIGVTAVIARSDGAGNTLRGVEIGCCTPRFDEVAPGGRRKSEEHAAPRSSGVTR